MDRYATWGRQRNAELADAAAKVGIALLALPLDELPPLAKIEARNDSLSEGLRVEMQLGAGRDDTAAALTAWADSLPERAVTAQEYSSYIYVEVSGVLDGVTVAVWTHFKGREMGDAARVLGLPLDGHAHAVPLAALRELDQYQASQQGAGPDRESCHA